MSTIYAIDFDGTLCLGNSWPDSKLGVPNLELFRFLSMLKNTRDVKFILWTCRTDQRLDEVVQWCADYGLIFDAVNENLQECKDRMQNDPRKIYANYYIDDKAINVNTDLNWR